MTLDLGAKETQKGPASYEFLAPGLYENTRRLPFGQTGGRLKQRVPIAKHHCLVLSAAICLCAFCCHFDSVSCLVVNLLL